MLLYWVVYDDETYALPQWHDNFQMGTLFLSKSGSARNKAICDS